MSVDTEFKDYILDHLSSLGTFETKNMFGGTALMRDGTAFAKIKHGTLWLKVGDANINDFSKRGMAQYTYGKDNSRKLNFYETPADVLDDADMLTQWATKACEAANRSRK